jgi:Cohesin domain
MTNRLLFLSLCFVALSMIAVHAVPARASTVGIGAGSVQGAPAQEVEVPIALKGAADLGALELALRYDPAVLEFKAVEAGPLLKGVPVLESKAAEPGRLVLVLASLNSAEGDGGVIKVHFLVRGQVGQKSPLTVEDARAWEGKTNLEMLVTPEPGEFTVVSAPLPWLWILLAAGGVLLLLVLVIVASRRRGRAKVAQA